VIVSAVERSANRLLVYGDTDNTPACKEALRRWLARKTKEHIVPWLIRLAQEKGVELRNVVVKSQRTRWASCSAKKTISLNLRLLCLSEEFVRYILFHELAHCRYMNHSRRFWAEVQSFEPNYERLDAEIRNAWRYIPAWLGPSPIRESL
jgi:predicted metal-dependent hydrolase